MVKGHDGNHLPLGSDQLAPWVKDKFTAMRDAMLNWHFTETLEILHYCTPDSIKANYTTLVKYLIEAYGYSPVVIETVVTFAITKDYNLLVANFPIDPIFFYDTSRKAAIDKHHEETSPSLKDRKRFVIEFGSTTTKEDIKWYLDQYWNSEIKPKIIISEPKIQKRPGKDAMVRDSFIYTLRSYGLTNKQIHDKLDETYPYEKDDYVDDATISKIRSKYEPKNDWFVQPRSLFRYAIPKDDITTRFELVYKSKPESHFEFKKIEVNNIS